jgi:hypothetical protein
MQMARVYVRGGERRSRDTPNGGEFITFPGQPEKPVENIPESGYA